MTEDKIIAALKQVQTAVEANIVNINKGGCGVFAAIVGEELVKRGVEPEVIVSSSGAPVSIVRTKVKNNLDPVEWEDNGLWIDHVGLRFKRGEQWFTYDSDALTQGHNWFGGDPPVFASAGSLTMDEIKSFNKDYRMWNHTFNRRQIPKLRKLVSKVFEGVDHD